MGVENVGKLIENCLIIANVTSMFHVNLIFIAITFSEKKLRS
jgi:hypothetical protein